MNPLLGILCAFANCVYQVSPQGGEGGGGGGVPGNEVRLSNCCAWQ